jgi:hypothetical protein
MFSRVATKTPHQEASILLQAHHRHQRPLLAAGRAGEPVAGLDAGAQQRQSTRYASGK